MINHLPDLGDIRRKRLGKAGMALLASLGMVTAFAVAPEIASIKPEQEWVVEPLAVRPKIPEAAGAADVSAASPASAPATAAATSVLPSEPYFVREERILSGDTIARVFQRMEIEDAAALAFLRTDRSAMRIVSYLKPGRNLQAQIDAAGRVMALYLVVGADERVRGIRREGEGFVAFDEKLQTETFLTVRAGEIRASLFGATDDLGIPDGVAVKIAEIFGSEIDFHRDLKRGDRFSVVYETVMHHGRPFRSGRVLAAEFINNGKTYRAFYNDRGDGTGDYYTDEGNNLRKAFLRSPLEFSRVTSGFGMRLHPIQGAWRAHKGVDYGAPTGTRVLATADGKVEEAGNKGGYGKMVVLRHQGKYTTAYAHLSGIAAGLRTGQTVRQGQVIGYVGSTGWATGPHLHYEFRIDGVHQNPLVVALPTAVPLSRTEKTIFMQRTASLRTHVAMVRGRVVGSTD